MRRPCQECGRPAVATVTRGKKRKRKAQAGAYYSIRGHDYCPACWEKVTDAERARKLKGTGEAGELAARVAELEALVMRLAERVYAAHEVLGRVAERRGEK